MYVKFIILLIIINFINISGNNKVVKIIATGELHGQIADCQCPNSSGGGLSGISSYIKSLKNKMPALLLDAGGYVPGGIYDLNSKGLKNDSIKANFLLEALALTGYDAVGIGDEELQYDIKWLQERFHKLDINALSANIQNSDSTYLFKRYDIIEKANVKFLITALTTQEIFLNRKSGVIIQNPLNALNEILEEVKINWDVLIVLSHLGEELSRLIINNDVSFPVVVINGHKKNTTEAGLKTKNRVMLQFGFLGDKISYTKFNQKNKTFTSPQWFQNSDNQDQDVYISHIQKAFEKFDKFTEYNIYDLYIMSQCPYGLPVLQDLNDNLNFKNSELNIWFIGDSDSSGNLHSLRGEDEVLDELYWLFVKYKYPEYWNTFISLVSSNEYSTTEAINELKINIAYFKEWVSVIGRLELKKHYDRSNKLNINASPTLFYNNKPFNGEFSSNFIRFSKCQNLDENNNIYNCDSLPECFTDSNCSKKNHFGFCKKDEKGWGKCVYEKDSSFKFTIIKDGKSTFPMYQDIVKTTVEMFPAAEIIELAQNDEKALKIIKEYDVKRLPFSVFSPKSDEAKNYNEISKGLQNVNNNYIFKPDFYEGTYFLKRQKKAGYIIIFIDLSIINDYLINTILKLSNLLKANLTVVPIFRDDIGKLKKFDNLKKNEKKLLSCSIQKKNHSLLKNDIEEISSVSYQKTSEYYKSFYNLQNELNITNHDISILLNNNEIVLPESSTELKIVFEKILLLVK